MSRNTSILKRIRNLMIYVYLTLNLFCIFWRTEKKGKKITKAIFFFLLVFLYSSIQWKTQEIINTMLDLNSVQCIYHKTADHIRTRIHQLHHSSFDSHEYEGWACLECPFSWHALAAVRARGTTWDEGSRLLCSIEKMGLTTVLLRF